MELFVNYQENLAADLKCVRDLRKQFEVAKEVLKMMDLSDISSSDVIDALFLPGMCYSESEVMVADVVNLLKNIKIRKIKVFLHNRCIKSYEISEERTIEDLLYVLKEIKYLIKSSGLEDAMSRFKLINNEEIAVCIVDPNLRNGYLAKKISGIVEHTERRVVVDNELFMIPSNFQNEDVEMVILGKPIFCGFRLDKDGRQEFRYRRSNPLDKVYFYDREGSLKVGTIKQEIVKSREFIKVLSSFGLFYSIRCNDGSIAILAKEAPFISLHNIFSRVEQVDKELVYDTFSPLGSCKITKVDPITVSVVFSGNFSVEVSGFGFTGFSLRLLGDNYSRVVVSEDENSTSLPGSISNYESYSFLSRLSSVISFEDIFQLVERGNDIISLSRKSVFFSDLGDSNVKFHVQSIPSNDFESEKDTLAALIQVRNTLFNIGHNGASIGFPIFSDSVYVLLNFLSPQNILSKFVFSNFMGIMGNANCNVVFFPYVSGDNVIASRINFSNTNSLHNELSGDETSVISISRDSQSVTFGDSFSHAISTHFQKLPSGIATFKYKLGCTYLMQRNLLNNSCNLNKTLLRGISHTLLGDQLTFLFGLTDVVPSASICSKRSLNLPLLGNVCCSFGIGTNVPYFWSHISNSPILVQDQLGLRNGFVHNGINGKISEKIGPNSNFSIKRFGDFNGKISFLQPTYACIAFNKELKVFGTYPLDLSSALSFNLYSKNGYSSSCNYLSCLSPSNMHFGIGFCVQAVLDLRFLRFFVRYTFKSGINIGVSLYQ